MQYKKKILNKDENWNRLKNYRPNDVVNHNNNLWQNLTGVNSEPSSDSTDWVNANSSSKSVTVNNISADSSDNINIGLDDILYTGNTSDKSIELSAKSASDNYKTKLSGNYFSSERINSNTSIPKYESTISPGYFETYQASQSNQGALSTSVRSDYILLRDFSETDGRTKNELKITKDSIALGKQIYDNRDISNQLKLTLDSSYNNFEPNQENKYFELKYPKKNGIIATTDDIQSPTIGSIDLQTDTSVLIPGLYNTQTSGTYTNANNIVVKEGYYTILEKKSDGTWVLASEVKLPMQDLTEIENEIENTKTKVDDFIEDLSVKVLPNPLSFETSDNPAIKNRFFIVDSDNKVVHETADARDLESLEKRSLPIYAEYLHEGIDRPDLQGILIVDSDNNIIFPIANQNTEIESVNRYDIATDITSFQLNDEYFRPENIYSEFDSLVDNKYITKRTIGKTSIKNLNINSYVFSPKFPKHKLLLIGGTHASEKVYQKVLLEFAKRLKNDFIKSDLLTYLRTEVEVHIIPLLCPANALGLDNTITGGRRCAETEPININWTKTGDVVTINLDVDNFPTTNPNVNGSMYFSDSIVNKLVVTIFESSDDTILPNDGYELKSIISGSQITVNTSNTTNGNGTAKLVVYVDPNRNMNVDNVWSWQSVSKNLSQYPSDYGKSAHDNLGTKPLSLSETKALYEYMVSESFDYMLDCHSGAGTNYFDALVSNNFKNVKNSLNRLTDIVTATSTFQLNDADGVVDAYKLWTVTRATFTAKLIELGGFGGTIEWSNKFSMDVNDSSQSYNLLTNVINFFTNIKRIK